MEQKRKFNWSSGLFIIGYHLLIIALLPLYLCHAFPSAGILLISLLLLYATGLSITGGYHRLFSHSTYKVHKVVEVIYLFFGTMATQGSALRWAHDHRLHHAHVDTDKDPYSVKKGFWYAHLFWMFYKQPPVEERIVSDLMRNKLLVFQNKYYEILMVATNALVALLIGFISGDYFGAFLFTWLIRLFFLHHFTWFINSLAHYWGHQNYSTEHSAVDNYLISMLTFGEGYHNYHHTFAGDYRNGIRWYHFDPSKWIIWGLSKVGLAHGLKRANETRISILMIEEHKKALLEKLTHSFTHKKEEFEAKITLFTESLTNKLSEMQQLVTQYKASLKDEHAAPQTLKKDINYLRKALKREWRAWRHFSKRVMRLKSTMPLHHH